VVTGAGGLNGTYEARVSFDMTSFTFPSTLAPSRTDISSILKAVTDTTITSGEIRLEDLRCGLFDNAVIEIFIVNYEDISQGTLDLIKGNWGDVKLKDGGFAVDVRSQAERLRKRFVDVFSLNCRVDLFSAECGLSSADFTESSFVETVVSQLDVDLPTGKSLVTVQVDVLVDAAAETDTAPQKASERRVVSEGQGDNGVIWTPGTDPDPLDMQVDGFPAILKLVQVTQTEDGTPRRPFQIATTAELNSVRNNVYASYALVNDIDMVAFGTWTPIPNFYGQIDGRGYIIDNLDVDLGAAADPSGLIDVLEQGAVIRRLGIENSDFRGTDTAQRRGAFAVTMEPASAIIDCYSFNCSFDGNNMGGIASRMLGGNSAWLRGPVIMRCWSANIMQTGSASAGTNGLVIASPAAAVSLIDTFGDNEYSQDNGGVEINSPNGGIPTSDLGTRGLTTVNMQLRASYVAGGDPEEPGGGSGDLYTTLVPIGFQWGSPWMVDDGSGYPQLIEQAVI
jgi:hypothetical protein